MLKNIRLFCAALLHYWVILLTGGVLMAVVTAWAFISNSGLPGKLGLLVLAVTFVSASFLAWKREHDQAESQASMVQQLQDAMKREVELHAVAIQHLREEIAKVPVPAPALTVRNVAVRPAVFERRTPVQGQFYVANSGGEAVIRESHCIVVGVQGRLPMERPYEGQASNDPVPRGTVIPAGGSVTGVFFEPNPFPDIDPRPLAAGNVSPGLIYPTGIYVMGWIECCAADGAAQPRIAFCRKYDWERGRFVAVDNSDYEY